MRLFGILLYRKCGIVHIYTFYGICILYDWRRSMIDKHNDAVAAMSYAQEALNKLKEETKMADNINHPSHYETGKIACYENICIKIISNNDVKYYGACSQGGVYD